MIETKKTPILDIGKELFSQFGIPMGTPLSEVPFQFLRHITLNPFKLTVNINIGNKVIPFIANREIVKQYYNLFNQPKQMHWIDPRYRFFGDFYQKGDDSNLGYLSEVAQTQKERTREEVAGVLSLLKLSPGASIADCPCGIGRHSIELAKRGYRMLAVDLTYDQIKVGVENAIKDPVIKSLGDSRLFFVLDSMLNIGSYTHQQNSFDAVINMFYSFGFFDKEEENEKVARNFFNLLKPGGKFLMHTDVNMATIRSGKYKLNEDRPLQHGGQLRIIDRFNPRTKRIDGSWIIGDQIKDYSVRVYEVEEFVTLCKKVGFKDVKVYSDWKGSSYTDTSEMVIFVAEK